MININRVSRKWLERAIGEEDNFDRFVYAWFAFNAIYSQFTDAREIDEIRQAIRAQTHSVSPRTLYNFLNRDSVKFFGDRVIRNMKNPERVNLWNHQTLKNSNNSNEKRIMALFGILYQIRCNLFHGNKLFDRDSDQEVIKNAQDVLINYLRLIKVETY
ncbi:MAG TPA: HEPN domain-containing protein [Saprospiraceae bacterium]|nr:HEPN domain-containing protein [Saprospiraceae bacterium]